MKPDQDSLVGTSVIESEVIKYKKGREAERISDSITVEEPLEIKLVIRGKEVVHSVVMRTPGHDLELALGLLYSDGIIGSISDVDLHDNLHLNEEKNVIKIKITKPRSTVPRDPVPRFINSSCGLCGKASIDQLYLRIGSTIRDRLTVSSDLILELPGILRDRQKTFRMTGGIHAAGAFTPDGLPLYIGEDVGRHNAVDKVIGMLLLENDTGSGKIIQVSGRCGFEILQKSALMGFPIVSAVSAPSSLAVQTAEALGITVVGFNRTDGFNVYSHPERIIFRRDHG
ncbi:MAG TPA: formate dehydrogenase accessory sulfurtransferase FdhD [Thermoplasmataceae archaeon]|nr:formate dehydrogenase accessory sulfurtransferase FdhD [Thermoplasmataceae archaeon]